MANIELDPVFLRGLKLLHSKSHESTEQLKSLVDEAIRQKQNGSSIKSLGILKKEPLSRSLPTSRQGSPSRTILLRAEEVPQLDTESQERKDDYDLLPVKRSKLDSPKSKSHTPSPTPSSHDSDSLSKKSDDLDDDEDLVGGLLCVVCHKMEIFARNNLVECQECRSLYHQECHKPAITEQEANDPRGVWYCANCTKNIKKPVVKSKQSKSSDGSDSSSPEILKTSRNDNTGSQLLFKRSTSESSHSSTKDTGGKPSGMAGYAASMKSSSKSHGGYSNSYQSGKSTAVGSSLLDKRLQQMKRKAARTQEKKKLGK